MSLPRQTPAQKRRESPALDGLHFIHLIRFDAAGGRPNVLGAKLGSKPCEFAFDNRLLGEVQLVDDMRNVLERLDTAPLFGVAVVMDIVVGPARQTQAKADYTASESQPRKERGGPWNRILVEHGRLTPLPDRSHHGTGSRALPVGLG
jgi:hypothetical protein